MGPKWVFKEKRKHLNGTETEYKIRGTGYMNQEDFKNHILLIKSGCNTTEKMKEEEQWLSEFLEQDPSTNQYESLREPEDAMLKENALNEQCIEHSNEQSDEQCNDC
jgi:hypothetical protein